MDGKIIVFAPSKRTQRDFSQNMRMPKDFTIINNSQNLSCHSFIFFQAKIELIETLINKGIKEFHINENLNHVILEKYILYLYNDEVYEITFENIIDLFNISTLFGDNFLKLQIEYYISININQNTIPILIFELLKINDKLTSATFKKILEYIVDYTKKRNICSNYILSEKILSQFIKVIEKEFSLSQLEDLLMIICECYGFEDSFKLILIDTYFSRRKEINLNDIRNVNFDSNSLSMTFAKEFTETAQNFIDKYININELDTECYQKYYKKYTVHSDKEENELMMKIIINEIAEKNKKLKEIEDLNNSYIKIKENNVGHSNPCSHSHHSNHSMLSQYSNRNKDNILTNNSPQMIDNDNFKSIIIKKNMEIEKLLEDYNELNNKVGIILERSLSMKDMTKSNIGNYRNNTGNGSGFKSYNDNLDSKRHQTHKNYERLLTEDLKLKPKKETTKHIGKYFAFNISVKNKLSGHDNGQVNCLLYIKKRIISGGNDHCIKIWDASIGNCIKSLLGHNGYIYHLEHIKDYSNSFDTIVASASWDNTIKIWNIELSSCLTTLIGHQSSVRCCLYLKDFHRNAFASGDNDGEIIIWNLGKGEASFSIDAHEGSIYCLLFLNDLDNKFMVSSGEDTRIKLWDIENRVCVETLIGHNNEVRSLIYLNAWENCLIASGGDDSLIKIWNIESEECEITLKGHTSYVRTLIYLKNVDEVTLISGGWDNLIKLWKVNRGQCIKTFSGICFVNSMIYLDDHEKITFVTGDDETLKIWEIHVYQPVDLSRYL